MIILTPFTLEIPVNILYKMKHHVQVNFPIEACGLLAGRNNHIQMIEIVTNSLQSQTEFRMEPEEQINALTKFYSNELDLLAIFHSHPKGPAHPSQKDLRLHFYPNTAIIILSPAGEDWQIHGFSIKGEDYKEIKLEILSK
jgi:proteasome lid subunit RPN8/RPN11